MKNPHLFSKYGKDRSHKKHDISQYEWDECRLYFSYRCAYCGMTWEEHKNKYNQDLHQEHVVYNGDDDLSNCIPSCRNCNSQKWEFSFQEWYNEKNPNFDTLRLNRINQWLDTDYKTYFGKKIYRGKIITYK